MREFVSNCNEILEAVVEFMTGDDELMEAKLTPYQKAQRNRRQTVATHTHRPAKASTFYVHAVRAIFQNLRKRGESFTGSAKGGQNIARTMMTKHGYATGQPSGAVRLTSKGRKRNQMHAREPAHVKNKKQRAYDYIMGIQRRKKAKKAAAADKAMGAG